MITEALLYYKLILVLNRMKKTADYWVSEILTEEFYNLKDDPNECNDLYGKMEIELIQKEFKTQLLQYLHSP